MPEQKEIEALIIDAIQLLAKDFKLDNLSCPNAQTLLYDNEGSLDSIALVNLISDIEEALYEKYNISITLADEKAISAHKSPYRSVTSLIKAVVERMPN